MSDSDIGIAGSSAPFDLYNKSVTQMLEDGIKQYWDIDVSAGGTIPPALSEMIFAETYVGVKHINIALEPSNSIRPPDKSSTDGRYQQVETIVPIHIYVRGKVGTAGEPEFLNRVMNGLIRIIRKRPNSLIPFAEVKITDTSRGRQDVDDIKKNLWHQVMRVTVTYWEVVTV